MGEEWGLMEGSFNIITGIALLIGGLIVTNLGFQSLFITMGIIQVIATIVVFVNFNVNKKY
jgi:predicted MFS family arabinose efflux permease